MIARRTHYRFWFDRLESIVRHHLITAREEERRRLRRDLHDGLGQLLTAISYAVQKIDEEHSVNEEFVERLQIQVNTAILEAKNIAQNLAPIVLKDFGLPAAIENLVQRTNLLKKTHFIFNSYAFFFGILSNILRNFHAAKLWSTHGTKMCHFMCVFRHRFIVVLTRAFWIKR